VPKTVASGQFEICRKLGEGCFGEVYSGKCCRTGESVAVKLENSQKTDLQHEVSVLKTIGQASKMPQGFAQFYHFGKEGRYNCLVMERLGLSLMDLHKAAGDKFTPKTAALIGEQALRCLELLHSFGIVHRDIKPENFMCGLGSRVHHLYLIDFGMAAKYYSSGKHTTFQQVSGFSGNLRYASINAHRLFTQSRRDDLEALGHMLYFFLLGRLPWSGLPAKNWKEQNNKVMEKKECTPLSELNAGNPGAFEEYLAYCRSLGFTSRPDYTLLRNHFAKVRELLSKQIGRIVEDSDLDWVRDSDKPKCVPLQQPSLVRQPEDNTAYVPRVRGLGRLCGSRPTMVSEPELPLAVAAA